MEWNGMQASTVFFGPSRTPDGGEDDTTTVRRYLRDMRNRTTTTRRAAQLFVSGSYQPEVLRVAREALLSCSNDSNDSNDSNETTTSRGGRPCPHPNNAAARIFAGMPDGEPHGVLSLGACYSYCVVS